MRCLLANGGASAERVQNEHRIQQHSVCAQSERTMQVWTTVDKSSSMVACALNFGQHTIDAQGVGECCDALRIVGTHLFAILEPDTTEPVI